MSQFRLLQSVAAGMLLALAPFASPTNAQTVAAVTCPGGGPRALTKAESSLVNDYEILLAKAQSQHATPPPLTPDIAALMACTSGGPVTPTASSGPTTATTAVSTCPGGGPRPLTKAENSLVNDYEILLAKAQSQHTTPPDLSPDIAALISCTSGPAAPTPPAPTSTSASTSASTSPTTPAKPATCAIALGPLTTQQNSLVNDYEVLVAKANSHHTAVPPMPDTVAALIGCE